MPSGPPFLDGGGETGALMRAIDWSRTPLGPVDAWPQSLRTTVSTCLNSRFPIVIWWGPQLVKLYNDAYRDLLGAKHPRAMGAAGRDVWPEIWHIIGPMLEGVVRDGRATWSEDQLLPLERHGFAEECYFTFSYSPIRDESGGVGGVFCAVTETTGRVIGERRLRLLQALAADAVADTASRVAERAMATLAGDAADVPFALLYLLDGDGTALRLASTAAGAIDPRLAAETVLLDRDDASAWPFRRALDAGEMQIADAAGAQPVRAFVTPVRTSRGAAVGVLVAGISPMLAVDEQYRGFATLIAREIGGSLDRARALEYERQRAEALAEIDRVKTAFFSNVSHEFRTPLTLMLSPIEEALANASQSLSGPELATVHRNALRLLKLVNTLLDFSRIEAGRARAVFEPTDLAQLTADLASTFRSAMTRAGLTFEVDCPPLAAPVQVDREAWEKIVLNLLSNALKFTFAGSVTVSLHGRGDQVELVVRDTGVGIPDAELPHLFDRFHRVQGAQGRAHEGSGIGLALVSELTKLHHGAVSVASRIGDGTTFTVSIPMRTADRAAQGLRPVAKSVVEAAATPFIAEATRWTPGPGSIAAPRSAAAAAGEAQSARILVADDNADMREYVSRLLSDRWTVEAVPNGAAALDAVRARRPTLVVADVMMPVLDGFGLLRELRSRPDTRDLPVILLSARAGEEASVEGLEAGADDYVAKPFSARELRARVEAQLLRAELRSIQAAHDRRLAEMFRHAPVAIAVLRGPNHVFEFVNGECVAVIGGRQVLGRTAAEAVPELVDQGLITLLDQVYESGQPYAADSMSVTLTPGRSGAREQTHFNFVCQPVRDERGRVDGIAVLAVDVSELARARLEAEAANDAKDQFLAVLGHELRTPLAPILTAVKLLEMKGPNTPDLQRLRQTISRQANQLSKLVEDLLDVGRIIAGKLRLERTRVELGAMVRQAVEASSPFIEERRHTLDVTLPPHPVYVDADAGRIVQVLCNLLNNAARYMDNGGHIDLSVSEEAGAVLIRVRDQGIGIAREMLDRVFDRFVQAGADRPAIEGLGIGLSVVKTIIELHGGTVAAYSDGPGTGSEFAVRLPVPSPAMSTC